MASELTASAAAMSSGAAGVSGAQAATAPSTSTSASAPSGISPLQNRAADSSSPYIRDHKDGLVLWQLLDSESVRRAEQENKLILLHIGYRACHHCRMMDLESFSNPEVASILNESFIPVIVDRETRPDIDHLYMNYVQAVSNAGGWPLNIWVTPQLEPVFGGTYWPGPGVTLPPSIGDSGDEVPDFLMILQKVRDVWAEQEERCRNEAKDVLRQLQEFASEGVLGAKGLITSQTITAASSSTVSAPAQGFDVSTKESAGPSELDLDQVEEAVTHIAGTFDPICGGFGLAPKFLTPPKLAFLLQLNNFPSAVQDVVGYDEVKTATEMALVTLRKIRDGALRDHIGGTGFTRCSITSDWTLPNFEKLVVDNALLLSLYLEAWKMSGAQQNSEFYDVVVELAEYLSSPPIALPGGGFASSEAADSYMQRGDKDMREGGYYLWTRKEFDDVVEPSDKHVSPVVAGYWDIREDGNVDRDLDPHDDYMNQNIPRIKRTPEELSKQFSVPVENVHEYILSAKKQLKDRRDRERVRPQLDDKVVAGWNGLVISSLARAGVMLQHVDLELSQKVLGAAAASASFIKEKLWDDSRSVLYRIWSGERDEEGFAEDYADVIFGLLDLFDATSDESIVEFADTLQKVQLSLFYDAPSGGFFSTTSSTPHSILRLKDGMDTSLPSTNAVSVSNLFRLAALLNDDGFAARASDTVDAFEVEMLQHPWLFPGLLAGLVTARLGRDDGVGERRELRYKAVREKV